MKRAIRFFSGKEDWLLRVAVAFPLLWAGIRSVIDPASWVGFVPDFIGAYIAPEDFLVVHGFVWVLTATGIIAGFWRPFFAFLAFAGLAGILIFYGVDDITFRDVGLVLTAFVLFLREVRR